LVEKKNIQQFVFPQIKKKCSDSSIKQLIFHWHFYNDRGGRYYSSIYNRQALKDRTEYIYQPYLCVVDISADIVLVFPCEMI
jgi:hypothetical protein